MLFYFYLKALKKYSYIFSFCYFEIGVFRVAKHQTCYVKVIVQYYILIEYSPLYLCVIYSRYHSLKICVLLHPRDEIT